MSEATTLLKETCSKEAYHTAFAKCGGFSGEARRGGGLASDNPGVMSTPIWPIHPGKSPSRKDRERQTPPCSADPRIMAAGILRPAVLPGAGPRGVRRVQPNDVRISPIMESQQSGRAGSSPSPA